MGREKKGMGASTKKDNLVRTKSGQVYALNLDEDTSTVISKLDEKRETWRQGKKGISS